jgi:hypothetical protein
MFGASGGGGGRFSPVGGAGSLFAQAPRTTYFYPGMVTITGTYRLTQASTGFALTGSGRLIATHKSPVASSFTFQGTAAFSQDTRQPCNARTCAGTLTLRFAVQSG